MTETKRHKWEGRTGYKAPFRVVDLIELPSKSLLEHNPLAYNNAMAAIPKGLGVGSCAVCGTGIHYNFVIKDAEGAKFVVGSTCVTYVDDYLVKDAKRIRKSHDDAKKAEARRKKFEEGKAEWEAAMKAKRDLFIAENKELIDKVRATGNKFGKDIIDRAIFFANMYDSHREMLEKIIREHELIPKETNEYYGVVGEMVETELFVAANIDLGPNRFDPYGRTNWLVILKDRDGRTFKYIGAASFGPKGDIVLVRAKVKAHDEYKGVANTVIMRPKVLEVLDGWSDNE